MKKTSTTFYSHMRPSKNLWTFKKKKIIVLKCFIIPQTCFRIFVIPNDSNENKGTKKGAE